MAQWRDRTTSTFDCEKTPVSASRGMAVTNHPLASAAALEIMAQGGNAVDATVAALFTLTVVEPMMVGIFGGGTAVIRLADGRELVIDGLATAPAMTRPDSYTPVSDQWPDYMETEGRANRVGAKAIAVPGNLMAWCEIAQRFGKLDLPTLMEPAIRHAARGFAVTPYLATCIEETASDLALDPAISAIFLPNGKPLRGGQPAGSIRLCRNAAHDRAIRSWRRCMAANLAAPSPASSSRPDRSSGRRIWPTTGPSSGEPVRGTYRGVEIIGPPPPCSGGVHTIQILNILEAFDIGASGFGTPQTLHLVLEALKIAAADRRAATADPAFVDVPIARLISKDYAKQRRAEIDPQRAGAYTSKVLSNESANTTHVTIADGDGNIVTSTQTINSLFGARLVIPGTGIIPNNYMFLFDPHPGLALSLMPGKRITSGISALIGKKDGKPLFALGLPGAHRIPSCVLQAVLNIVDHGMSVQEVVEAPRVFSWGLEAEVERGFPESVRSELAARGHDVVPVDHVGGGMCAISFRAGRDHDGRGVLARRWRAGRDRWRTGARQHVVLAGSAPAQAEIVIEFVARSLSPST